MASLRQIRHRMKSIENIHEITKAMEMIAAFRFKKAENRFTRCRSYFMEMEKLVANLSAASPEILDPCLPPACRTGRDRQALFERRVLKKKALVVMTGDKGLCGAYNTNLLRYATGWIKENAEFETAVVPVGKVGCEFFKKRQTPALAAYPDKSMADLALAKQITVGLKDLFLTGAVDSVEVLYTSYRAGGTGRNEFHPFLSLDYLAQDRKGGHGFQDYIYEPGLREVFRALLTKFLEGKIYLCLLESLTSEYSARMVAMKQATENGEEVLDDLRLLRNKTRQATITRELSEIVSGASVLI